LKRIGIIIPVYNSGIQLAATIDSILFQAGNYDCQILLINDFSTDETTREILHNYINERCVTIVNNIENVGICESRNIGLKLLAPSTDFVMFVDHDDVLAPLAFQNLMGAFNDDPNITAVMGSAYKFGPLVTSKENESFIESQRKRRSISFHNGRFDVSYITDNLLTYPAILSSYTFHPPAKAMIRSDALLSSGVIFEKRFELVEDWIFWIKLLKYGNIHTINELTAGYYWHQSNNSQRTDQIVKLKYAWRYLFWYSLQSRIYFFSYLKTTGANKNESYKFYNSLPNKTFLVYLRYWYNSVITFLIRAMIQLGEPAHSVND
jgi:glycosyltransferase involved in cell wall biosynthesis